MRPGNRDDMVIQVRMPEPGAAPSSQGGTTEDDAAAPARRTKSPQGRGLVKKALKVGLLRKLLSRSALAGAVATVGRSVVGMAATPQGALAAMAAMAGLASLRAMSGRTLESMGWQLEYEALGDAPADAAAALAARASMHPYLLRYVAQNGFTPAARAIYDLELRNWRDEMRGRAQFMRSQDFQANSTVDLVLLATAKAAARAWNDSAGPKWTATLMRHLRGLPLTAEDFSINQGDIK